MQPHEYPRRILLSVTGLSPQIVTETLYALAVARAMPFYPTEVHLVTTGEGAERARLTLLGHEPGWFSRLCHDYDLPAMDFNADSIHTIRDADGMPVEDIRDLDSNESAADVITDLVRTQTMNDDAAVHMSIAGGRKTMGFYAGYALSLFGRPQDRLSHVLVSAPFESHPDFYYTTPYSRIIYSHDATRKPLDTKDARVELAEIPFVRMRQGPSRNLQDGTATFSRTVAAAQRALEPPRLLIDTRAGRVSAGGEVFSLAPQLLAFYAWLARRRMHARHGVTCPPDGAPVAEYAVEFLAEYRGILGEMGDDDRTAEALEGGMSKAYFEQTKSKLHRELKKALDYGATPYLVAARGDNRRRSFGLSLLTEAINFGTVKT